MKELKAQCEIWFDGSEFIKKINFPDLCTLSHSGNVVGVYCWLAMPLVLVTVTVYSVECSVLIKICCMSVVYNYI